MCMPMGGIIPFKGVEKSMVIIHGSQGCCTYMRRHISEHFNEPVDVASSSLNEKETIYGGEKNLKKALDNVMKVYVPTVIGVLTTCLTETIGEDIDRIVSSYREERGLDDVFIITVPTPGYGGTHSEGYFMTARRIIEEMIKQGSALKYRKKPEKPRINVIIPHISPADIREIKRLLDTMGADYILFPDYSDTLDSPFSRPYKKIPDGGTKILDICSMTESVATVQMGVTVDDKISPGKYLQKDFGIPLYNIPIPIGIDNTDLFLNTLKMITGNEIPEDLKKERGRLIDCMIDSHKYNSEGRCAIIGEPENVYAVSKLCMENGVYPAVVATGSKNNVLLNLLKNILYESPYDVTILSETDFTTIRQKCREMGVNIAIGHSDGRYLTEREGIPLVRYGYPIHDRVGGQRILSVGYRGTMMFLDRITNTLLERKHRNYRESLYKQFYTA
uniref:nitrogenase component 1 n=1 Tax=Caldanaerobius polysaccharolyticus TaxID=44256 RepID=UPI00068F09B2